MDQNILLICIFLMTILLFITIFILLIYSGLFSDFEIGAGKPPIVDAKVYYKTGEGSYKDTGPVFCDVTSIAPKHKSFAVYYDNPSQIGTRERWAVGVILAEGSEEPDPTLIEAFTKQGYKPFNFPKVQNVVKTTYAHISSLSVIFASYRVYPRLNEYIKEKKLCAHPWIEIYDGETISYMVPLAKQEEFYVPEVLKSKLETSERKHKKRKRIHCSGKSEKRECSEGSDLELNGAVNIECVPVIECEHSYASVPDEKQAKDTGKAQKGQPVNSAGEVVVPKDAVNNTHSTRSKSVNILGPKPDKLVNVLHNSKPRSASAVPHNRNTHNATVMPPVVLISQAAGDNVTKLRNDKSLDRDTGNQSMDASEDSMNSSASSVSSSAETTESSFFSSEFSYSSADTCMSQNTSRFSCDSDTDKTF